MAPTKFDAHPDSMERKGSFTLTEEQKKRAHWNRATFYKEYYDMERWARDGFTAGYEE